MSVCIHTSHHLCLPFPQELSVLDDPKSLTGSKTAGQSPNAGWFNRFVQTGKSDHETKTNGCFGGRLHRCPITQLHQSHVCCLVFRLSCARFYIPGDVVYYPILQLVSGWGVGTRYIYICTYIYIYICIPCTAGLQVPVVSSSVTGNLHPTPCIEWMQGNRGDPGCMAKVPITAWLSVHVMC